MAGLLEEGKHAVEDEEPDDDATPGTAGPPRVAQVTPQVLARRVSPRLSVARPSVVRVTDRYGSDVLSGDWRAPKRGRAVETSADPGLVVEEVTTDWVGEIVAVDRDLHTVTLEDRRHKRRTFPLGAGFLLEGKPVILTAPVRRVAPAKPTRTASGSVAVHDAKARVARASRIFVEGRHDAELVEKVWGDDLRIEGVVVEFLGGVDDLADHLVDFKPGPQRRVGVLVDHLVPGLEGVPHRPGHRPLGGGQARPDRRPPVHRRVAGGQARPARPGRVAHDPALDRVEEGRVPAPRLAAPHPDRHRAGLAAHPRARSRPTTTSSPPCSAGSRSSSTS